MFATVVASITYIFSAYAINNSTAHRLEYTVIIAKTDRKLDRPNKDHNKAHFANSQTRIFRKRLAM